MRLIPFFIVWIGLMAGCGTTPGNGETAPVKNNPVETTEQPEDANAPDGNASISTEGLPEDLTNAIVRYKNDLGHELRLDIMGQNHETLWYYSEGDGEVQIIPMIGADDIYAMTTNEGTSLGNMHFKNIEKESGLDLPGEIEVDVDKGKSTFRRMAIED